LAFEGDWERWDALFVGERQVGYSHTKATEIGAGTEPNVRYELVSKLMLRHGPVELLQKVVQASTETNEGQLLDFEGTVSLGPATTRFVGSVSEGELKIETIRGLSRSLRTDPWGPTNRGLFAIEQSLRRQAMQSKGEERMLRMLLPGRYELVTARLRCMGRAAVPLLDGKLHQLIEIDCEIDPQSDRPSRSTIWTSESGEIARTHSPALQLIAYRADRAAAERGIGDSLHAASIPVLGTIDQPSQSTRVAYTIQPTKTAQAAGVEFDFLPAPGQYVRRSGLREFQVLVSRRPEASGKGFATSDLPPTERDLSANAYVDFDHEQIRRFSRVATGTAEKSPRETAMELTWAVHQNLSERLDVVGLANASSVTDFLIGDVTERAIFLVALLRERKIPARLAIGLKYVPGSNGRLTYHAWVIAYVDSDWIHLDPSEGGTASADRLVFATTDLGGDSEHEAFQKLLNLMTAIDVRIVGQN
jgi:transglutaminase-like putative cysteine protease